jgi:hypothetical protein
MAFLRQQLVVLKRSAPARLRLRTANRLIFVWLYRLFPSLLEAAVIFKPETLVIVCRPLACGWYGDTLPKSYFDVQDWNTEMRFSVGYKAEVDAMKRINSLIDCGAIMDPSYKLVHIYEVEPATPVGDFNYFIERDSVYKDAHGKADALFRWLRSGKVAPKP